MLIEFALVCSIALDPDDLLERIRNVKETDVVERVAQEWGIPEGDVEFTLPDGRRVDILDRENGIAWEADWCKDNKWAEAIGQAIGYASATDMEPGILLIYTGNGERWNQAQVAAEYLQGRGIPLHVRTVEP